MQLSGALSGEMRLNILGAKRESLTRILLYHLTGPSIVVE
jgi:hypothetical protein